MRQLLRDHWPEYLIEGLGLAAFMVSAGVFGTLLEYPDSPVRQALPDPFLRGVLMGLAMGATAVAIIYSPWGKRSGAHINPAVTLTFYRLGKIEPVDAAAYVAAQFAGGVAGVLAVTLLLGAAFVEPPVRYVATLPGSAGVGVAFLAEIGISFLLMLIILLATNARRLARFTGLFAGILVAAYIAFEAPVSGMSLNPARTFASALPGRLWTALWVYFTAPPIGMLLASEVYLRARGRDRVRCAKLHHDNDQRCIFRCGWAEPLAAPAPGVHEGARLGSARAPTSSSGQGVVAPRHPIRNPRGGIMDYDVIIIGAGQAGSPLARRLAGDGKRTLLVERKHVGGTCINYGCTPTKTMVASARAAHVARRAGRLGVRVEDVHVDLGAVVDRKDEIVRSFRDGQRERLEKTENLTLVDGQARFVGPREIEIDGARHRAGTIVVNAGARPWIPPIPGLDRIDWLDSTSIMELREVPEHLVVLGGGYVGCEFGQMFRRFGSEVTIVNRGPNLLDREDEDISTAIEGVFRDEGIALRLDAAAKGVSLGDASRTAVGAARAKGRRVVLRLEEGPPIEGTHILFAVGRVPNTDLLGCDAAGIELDKRGFIKVDDRYLTSAEGIYAVGDVTGGPQFTHTSWDDHRILYDILHGESGRGRSGRLVPYCVFTDPQVARVGLSEREAKEKGIAYEVATMAFGSIARAIELDETAGTMKILLDPETERVLGAAIVGVEAGELIHIFVTLMQAGASARAIVDAEAIHPTLAEGVQSLVMGLPRYSLA